MREISIVHDLYAGKNEMKKPEHVELTKFPASVIIVISSSDEGTPSTKTKGNSAYYFITTGGIRELTAPGQHVKIYNK